MSGDIFFVDARSLPFRARAEGGSLDGLTVDLPDRYPVYKHPAGVNVEWYLLIHPEEGEPFYRHQETVRMTQYRWLREQKPGTRVE